MEPDEPDDPDEPGDPDYASRVVRVHSEVT
jgi:hypothetical protein